MLFLPVEVGGGPCVSQTEGWWEVDRWWGNAGEARCYYATVATWRLRAGQPTSAYAVEQEAEAEADSNCRGWTSP